MLPTVQLHLPFVFGKYNEPYRFAVVRVDPDNHSNRIPNTFQWVTGEHFTAAGIRWQRYMGQLDVPKADATGPQIGSARWENERANCAEAQLRAADAVILMHGGYKLVHTPAGGDRQESLPEAMMRLLGNRVAETKNELPALTDGTHAITVIDLDADL